MEIRPDRLNLAIAQHCFVTCQGCYQFFGQSEPDLAMIATSVAEFVRLGIGLATISGGDPLTLRHLPEFLERLRAVGVREIKLDTVGTGLLDSSSGSTPTVHVGRLRSLLSSIDYLALPLDGGSNEGVETFRARRPRLYEETVALLNAIDDTVDRRSVVVNTVVHRMNTRELPAILTELSRHPSIAHWNLFQYTPTDQALAHVNGAFAIDDAAFADACVAVLEPVGTIPLGRRTFSTEARTIRSRLGQYLLINSDGHGWLPDERGTTVPLGPVAGREAIVLAEWADAARRIRRGESGRLDAPNAGRSEAALSDRAVE